MAYKLWRVGSVSPRSLNRATLDRQLLLARHEMPAREAVRHLAGLQGQAPLAPYAGLWCRLADFRAAELSALISDRSVVRAPVMRSTVHVMETADFAVFRPLFSPLMAGVLQSNYSKRLAGADLAEVTGRARGLLAERGPLTRAQLGKSLAEQWPDADPSALAYAVTYLVPVVQVPPRGIWGKSGQATWADAESWVAEAGPPASPRPPAPPASPGEPAKPAADAAARLVLRYLAAFGPATVADAQTWSGLTRLREVTERLDLRVLRGPGGEELLDLPDTQLPDEDVPAPPRFLPEYDNLLLSHADRSRVNPAGRQVPLWPGNGATQGTLLIDGIWDGLWKISAEALVITPFRRLTPAEEDAIMAEAAGLLAFARPDAPPPVRLAAATTG